MIIKNILSRFKRSPHKDPRPSLNNLDQKLAKYLNFKKGFFIEVGANDGYSQSNTYYLETIQNWHGILIEGIPELYERCRKERPKSTVINCALVSNTYKHKTITMHYAHLMSVVEGSLKSNEEQESHLEAGIEVQNLDASYSLDVPAKTLETILDNTIKDWSMIDFFSLDVEGYELNVLEGLNLNKYRPKYILVEARFFEEVNDFLERHQYKLVEKMSYHDYFYEKSSNKKCR